jgi:hypothetical protein
MVLDVLVVCRQVFLVVFKDRQHLTQRPLDCVQLPRTVEDADDGDELEKFGHHVLSSTQKTRTTVEFGNSGLELMDPMLMSFPLKEENPIRRMRMVMSHVVENAVRSASKNTCSVAVTAMTPLRLVDVELFLVEEFATQMVPDWYDPSISTVI